MPRASTVPALPAAAPPRPAGGAGARLRAALLALLAVCAAAPAARAAPPPDEEVAREEEAQNRLLQEAQRGGSMAGVVRTYESRLMRQESALHHYLLGRALFHHGDKAGAQRAMQQVVALEPGFWQAQVRLGQLHWLQKNAALARQHLDLARSRAASAPEVLRLSAEVGFGTKDYDLALAALTRLAALDPTDAAVRAALADVHAAREDWESAYRELRALRLSQPKNPAVRLSYAQAALMTKRFVEAAAEAEPLTRAEGGAENPGMLRRALDLLRAAYVELKDAVRLGGVLERLQAWAAPEARAELAPVIRELKAGRWPEARRATAEPPPASEEDLLERLVAACGNPDVAVRREALQSFFMLKIGWAPPALLLRFHPAEEPDPTCRAWVVRIVGDLQNAGFAKIAGHALQDPAPLVRRAAAEALGQIRAPVGLIYLLAYLGDLAVASPSEDTVQEYNAARAALVRLTGWDDVEVGEERWVPAAGLAASWARWTGWLESAEGTQAKLRGIRDVLATGETHPEWYLLVMTYDKAPEVATAAYRALEERSRMPSEDPVARALWPEFPKAAETDLTPEGLPGLRARIKTWWERWLAQRQAQGR